jgi:hypothetical protein
MYLDFLFMQEPEWILNENIFINLKKKLAIFSDKLILALI